MLIRTTWASAFVVSCSLWLAGCVGCGAPPTGQGGEREPAISSVMSLRYHLCQGDWAAASAAIAPGSEFAQRGGDQTTERFWTVAAPISEAPLRFPLGPEDEIGGAKTIDAQVHVELLHARRLDKDPRPRVLVLEQRDGQWLIVTSRNW